MSSIDPNIILKGRRQSDEAFEPLDAYSKGLQLKDILNTDKVMRRQKVDKGAQDIAIGSATLQNDQVILRQRQKEEEADNALTEAIKANHTIDDATGKLSFDDDAIAAAVTRAGHPEKALDYTKRAGEIKTINYNNAINGLKAQAMKTARMGQLAGSVLNADPSLRGPLYGFALQQAHNEGLIDPQHMDQIPTQYKGPETDALLQQLYDSAQDDPHKALAERMAEQRDKDAAALVEKINNSKLTEQTDKTTQAGLVTDSQLLGSATDQASWDAGLARIPETRRGSYAKVFSKSALEAARRQGVTPDKLATQSQAAVPNTPTELAYAAANGDKRAIDALQRLGQYEQSTKTPKDDGLSGNGVTPANVTGQRDENVLSKIDPGVAAIIKQIVDYDYPLPTSGMALAGKYWQRILGLAKEYDPNFSATQYGLRQKTHQDFNNGDASKNIRSINTVTQHLDELSKKVDDLNNFSVGIPGVTTANAIWNSVASSAGSSKKNNFDITRDAVANELENVFRGAGGGSLQGVTDWKNKYTSSSTPGQLKDGIKEAVTLMAGRIEALRQQYEKGIGRPMDFAILTPKSRETLKKFGIDPNQIEPEGLQQKVAPGGGDKKITEDAIQLLMKQPSNKGFTRAEIIEALKAEGYK